MVLLVVQSCVHVMQLLYLDNGLADMALFKNE